MAEALRAMNRIAGNSSLRSRNASARQHKSLANPYPRTRAMAAGIADHIWTYEEIADLLG